MAASTQELQHRLSQHFNQLIKHIKVDGKLSIQKVHPSTKNVSFVPDLQQFKVVASFYAKHESVGMIVDELQKAHAQAIEMLKPQLEGMGFKLTVHEVNPSDVSSQFPWGYEPGDETTFETVVFEASLSDAKYKSLLNRMKAELAAAKRNPAYVKGVSYFSGVFNKTQFDFDFVNWSVKCEDPAANIYPKINILNRLPHYLLFAQSRIGGYAKLLTTDEVVEHKIKAIYGITAKIEYKGLNYQVKVDCHNPHPILEPDVLAGRQSHGLIAMKDIDHPEFFSLTRSKMKTELNRKLVKGAKVIDVQVYSASKKITFSNWVNFKEVCFITSGIEQLGIFSDHDLIITLKKSGELTVTELNGELLKNETEVLLTEIEKHGGLEEVIKIAFNKNRSFAYAYLKYVFKLSNYFDEVKNVYF